MSTAVLIYLVWLALITPMANYTTNRQVNAPQDLLFRTVLDVENYPSIFPFIEKVEAQTTSECSMNARVFIRLGIAKFQYSCLITYKPNQWIDIASDQQPFKKLRSKWTFCQSGEKTAVGYTIQADFQSKWLSAIVNRVFYSQVDYFIEKIENKMVEGQ